MALSLSLLPGTPSPEVQTIPHRITRSRPLARANLLLERHDVRASAAPPFSRHTS